MAGTPLPRIDVSQITGSMSRQLEREERARDVSYEWFAAEGNDDGTGADP
jgi:hypothetical protein